MNVSRAAPLGKKLTRLAMTCSVVALVTTAVALGIYEWFFYRKLLFSHFETVATVTARNSAAALAFSSETDATRTLSALSAEYAVTSAALYDADGAKFAEYIRNNLATPFPETAPPDGLRLTPNRVEIALPVVEAKRFGTLLVRADLAVVQDRLGVYLLVLLGTTTVSGLLAFLLAARLKRRITGPLEALANAAAGVQTKADYSVRVQKADDDELGTLTDAFNAMLARIQQNENELQRGSERLRLAVESARLGTWDWDVATDNVTWNDHSYEMFGLPPGTRVTADIFFSRLHPEDQPRVRAAIETAVKTSTDFAAEFRVLQEGGELRYLAARGRILTAGSGAIVRAVGVTIDITERRRAELRVAESEQRFRVVTERAPALIWSCDAALNRDYFNRTWLAFTGHPLEQELGAGWLARVHPEDVTHWRTTAATAAGQHDPYSVEYRLRRADGAFRWVIETASPRLAAGGAFAGYLGTCIDITNRKENEAELEAHVHLRTRQLQLANEELESFSYSVSHDLRHPVRVIHGFAEIALEECEANNPPAAVPAIRKIMNAAHNMDELINAFITLAKISRAELKIETVNLSTIAEGTVASLRSVEPNRTVETTIAPDLTCRGDEQLLRIALDNLFGNAWKFSAGRDPARIEFGRRTIDGEPVFFVRDNGVGFNAAFSEKLFEAFQRLHNPSQFDGLGVGLNTVHRVIQRHHGRVWADSVEGEGATIYFTLAEEPTPPPL